MSITPVNYEPQSATATRSGSNSTLDFQSFMNLIAKELQNQDPTEPVKTSEYMAQLVQVQTLDQINQMYTLMGTNQAIDLVGKEVSYQTTDSKTGKTVTGQGTVQSIIASNGNVYVNVNGTKVDLKSIYQVKNTSSSTLDTSQAVAFIGKEVSYKVTDAKTGATTTAKGIVQSVSAANGKIYATINGSKVALDSIYEVKSPDTTTK